MHKIEGGLAVTISMTKIIIQLQTLMTYSSWVTTHGPSDVCILHNIVSVTFELQLILIWL